MKNLVAKHMKSSGSGVHVQKAGKYAPRAKNKQKFKNELNRELSKIQQY